MNDSPKPPRDEVVLRPHTYDGIQEFDQRLPNWWLLTLYGAIVFTIVYWFVHYESRLVRPDGARVEAEMARIEAVKLAALVDMVTDDNLWQMSRNPEFVAAGAEVFKSTCASCHGVALQGGIGPSLVDKQWIHGGLPVEVFKTINEGVLARGMPAWGQQIGARKVAEAAAYVLSHHAPGEEIVIVPSPAPGAAPAAP